jgi:hypothetical protein
LLHREEQREALFCGHVIVKNRKIQIEKSEEGGEMMTQEGIRNQWLCFSTQFWRCLHHHKNQSAKVRKREILDAPRRICVDLWYVPLREARDSDHSRRRSNTPLSNNQQLNFHHDYLQVPIFWR